MGGWGWPAQAVDGRAGTVPRCVAVSAWPRRAAAAVGTNGMGQTGRPRKDAGRGLPECKRQCERGGGEHSAARVRPCRQVGAWMGSSAQVGAGLVACLASTAWWLPAIRSSRRGGRCSPARQTPWGAARERASLPLRGASHGSMRGRTAAPALARRVCGLFLSNIAAMTSPSPWRKAPVEQECPTSPASRR